MSVFPCSRFVMAFHDVWMSTITSRWQGLCTSCKCDHVSFWDHRCLAILPCLLNLFWHVSCLLRTLNLTLIRKFLPPPPPMTSHSREFSFKKIPWDFGKMPNSLRIQRPKCMEKFRGLLYIKAVGLEQILTSFLLGTEAVRLRKNPSSFPYICCELFPLYRPSNFEKFCAPSVCI